MNPQTKHTHEIQNLRRINASRRQNKICGIGGHLLHFCEGVLGKILFFGKTGLEKRRCMKSASDLEEDDPKIRRLERLKVICEPMSAHEISPFN